MKSDLVAEFLSNEEMIINTLANECTGQINTRSHILTNITNTFLLMNQESKKFI